MTNYEEKMNELLEENLTKIGYSFWCNIKEKIPSVWDRPSSSTGKYHRKENNYVPNIAEHTYEMLFSCIKLWSIFDIKSKTSDGDTLLLAIALHDSFKYGENPENRKHTVNNHDKIIADKLRNITSFLLKFLSEDQVDQLEDSVRFHSGRWSKDATKDFYLGDYHPYVAFVHFLDMISTKDLIKI